MSTKSVPGMVGCLIACADETASFDQIVPLVECRGSEILIDRMDLKVLEGVDGRTGVLPDIANDVVKLPFFEHVDRAR